MLSVCDSYVSIILVLWEYGMSSVCLLWVSYE